MTFWNGVLWLHLIGMAFFVGGQLMLATVVVPVLRGLGDRKPLRAAARRFGVGWTLNFGNPRARVVFAVIVLALATLVVAVRLR